MGTVIHAPLAVTAMGGKIENIEFDVFEKGGTTSVGTANANVSDGYVLKAEGLTAGKTYTFKMKAAQGKVLAPSLQDSPLVGKLEFDAYVPVNGHSVATVQDTPATPFQARGFVNGETTVAVKGVVASNGTVAISASGAITYTPNTGFAGIDQFNYIVYEGAVGSNQKEQHSVVVTVNPSSSPSS